MLEVLFIKKYNLINLKSIFNTLTKYSLISLGFIPIYYTFKLLFGVYSYELTFKMIVMITFVIITSAVYYIGALSILKDTVISYAFNFIKNKIHRR